MPIENCETESIEILAMNSFLNSPNDNTHSKLAKTL